MAQIINTNVPSLMAQRNLSKSNDAMATSIQRLSSGLKINSAKDDAAGLAIATLMTSQIRGLNKAAKNSNDAISLAQIAEGAMGTSTELLQQMRELAIQSANGTNSSADRQALQAEVSQLVNEMDDIANNTQFNGQAILNGSFSNTSFQVGANANETISFSIDSIASTAVGQLASQVGTPVTATASTTVQIQVAGAKSPNIIQSSAGFAGSANGQDGTSAYAKAASINAANISGVSVSASNQTVSGTITAGTFGGTAGDVYSLKINGTSVFSAADIAGGMTTSTLAEAINGLSELTGVVASLNSTNTVVSLSAADGRTISVDETGSTIGGSATGTALASGSLTLTGQAGTQSGSLTISAQNNLYLSGDFVDLGFTSTIMTDTKGINTLDISTQAGAQEAIQRIDSALSSITGSRASMGAMENRFDSTIANLENISDNTEAARSRIEDTDYAAEMATFTKNQILQQAGTSMLAQANSMPQSVLSLLG